MNPIANYAKSSYLGIIIRVLAGAALIIGVAGFPESNRAKVSIRTPQFY